MASETTNYIIVFQETKTYTTRALYYIDLIWTTNIYTSSIRENVNKKIKFSIIISVVKTSIQVAIAEGITSKLTGLFTQFIIKYYYNIGLNIKEVHHSILYLNDEI